MCAGASDDNGKPRRSDLGGARKEVMPAASDSGRRRRPDDSPRIWKGFVYQKPVIEENNREEGDK